MRLIFTDESGTAAPEPVRVVAAVIIYSQDQLSQMEEELTLIYDELVPKNIRDNFQFHATDVFSGKKYPNIRSWNLQDRLDLIKAVSSLPRAFKAPIAFATHFRSATPRPFGLPRKIKTHEWEHMLAFTDCMERCSWFLKTGTDRTESATVVAESIPHMEKHLRKVYEALPMLNGYRIRAEDQRESFFQKRYLPVQEHIYNFDFINRKVVFHKKGVSPMLDVADACAFIIRRWSSSLPHSEDLLYCMLGEDRANSMYNDPVWTTSPGSLSLIRNNY